MQSADAYVVRVSIFGRPFEEDITPTTLAEAWTHKLAWEKEHRGYEPVAEVVHAHTGRVVMQPILTSSRQEAHTPLAIGLSLLKG